MQTYRWDVTLEFDNGQWSKKTAYGKDVCEVWLALSRMYDLGEPNKVTMRKIGA